MCRAGGAFVVAGFLEVGWAIGLKASINQLVYPPSSQPLTDVAIVASTVFTHRGPFDSHRHRLRSMGKHQRTLSSCAGDAAVP